jgi:hypothetical protein
MKALSFAIVPLLVCDIVGCAKANHVTIIKSPTPGVFFTIETFYGRGAVDSDFTRLYAHFDRNGSNKRILVLDGENLTIPKIVWIGPREDTICLKGGITNTFRNEVTLTAGNASVTVRNHLDEDCDTAQQTSDHGR